MHQQTFVGRLTGSFVAVSLLGILVVGFLVGPAVPTVAANGQDASRADVLALSEQLTAHLLEGRYEEVYARFAPVIAEMTSPAELGAAWTSLPLQMGALNDVGEAWIADTESLVFVRTPLYFEHITLDLVYAFDEDLLLHSFLFVPHEPQPAPAPAAPAATPTDETEATPVPEQEAAADGPPYADATKFVEYDLTFGLPEFPLGGTLTVPVGDGPFPAVVLVHGSGPSDRDETVMANKPFRDLAWGLASRGVAVFRYDKRTFVYGAAMAADPTTTVDDETIIDAVEAVRMLRERDDIGRIYIGGHSQGGMLAPYMALEEPSIDGLILMAANARTIGELLLEQFDYLLAGHAQPGTEAMVEAMQPEVERLVSGQLDGVDVLLGQPVHFWVDFQNRDQVGVATDLPQPMLILQGERDYQVTVTDFERWKEALAHKDNVAYRLYPGLNHLFMFGEGPGTPMEYAVPGYVAQEVIEDIAAWIYSQE